jgi:hypothetical protein
VESIFISFITFKTIAVDIVWNANLNILDSFARSRAGSADIEGLQSKLVVTISTVKVYSIAITK